MPRKSNSPRSLYSAARSATRGNPARKGKQSPYSRTFFMALIVTIISSVAFLGVLSLAMGAG